MDESPSSQMHVQGNLVKPGKSKKFPVCAVSARRGQKEAANLFDARLSAEDGKKAARRVKFSFVEER